MGYQKVTKLSENLSQNNSEKVINDNKHCMEKRIFVLPKFVKRTNCAYCNENKWLFASV